MIAHQKKLEGTDEEIAHDTSAFAIQGLLGSTQFRSAKVVKDLQKVISVIPNTMGGKDIHAMRREKKTGQELISQQNEMFIRNKLRKGTIEKPQSAITPADCGNLTLIVVTNVDVYDGFGMGKAELTTPMNLNTSGYFKPPSPPSVVGRRNRICRLLLKLKYNRSVGEEEKEDASKLVSITKSH